MPHDPTALPEDLVAPSDDGAADHLPDRAVPPGRLSATDGSRVSLAERCRGRGVVVVFAYPRTGRPGVEPLVPDWDQIPGARGCTPQACGFRDLAAEFESEGVEVFGLSTQSTDHQCEAVERLRLPYRLLSDAKLEWSAALRLPTFRVGGTTLLRRCTLLLARGRVERVQYPVFPPDRAAAEALALVRGGTF